MKPKWSKGERFERIERFNVKGVPEQVFPLLCPVREYDWLPGWSCTMHYSGSGVAEKDAVFTTVEPFRQQTKWTTISYEPNRFIEYLIVSGQSAVVRLSISLEAGDAASTDLTWRMLFTSTSRLGGQILRRRFSVDGYRRMLASRKSELDHYLSTGTMAGA
jgi:hypothetical protein